MTVASLLGPDKRHVKVSSDMHLSIYFVLSDLFYQEKRWFSDSKHIEPPQWLRYGISIHR